MFAIAAAIYAFFEYPYYAVDAYVSYCIAANYSLTFMVTLIGAGRPTRDGRVFPKWPFANEQRRGGQL